MRREGEPGGGRNGTVGLGWAGLVRKMRGRRHSVIQQQEAN